MLPNNKSILSISLDTSIVLGDLSASGLRQISYAKNFDEYVVILISTKTERLKSEYHFGNLHIYPTNVLFKPFAVLRAISIAKGLHAQYRFDLVSAQDPLATGLIANIIKRNLAIPMNIQLHSTYHFVPGWEGESWTNWFWKILIKPILRKADSVRSVNRQIIPILRVRYSDKHFQIAHIPVMVDLNYYYRRIKLKNNMLKFITVGRLIDAKNQELMLKAFVKIKALKPEAMLTIVGDGPLKKELKYAAKALDLGSSVNFVGKASATEVRKLLSQNDIYVSSSNYEGWGSAIVEAMAAGLPVVATKVGCLADDWLGRDIAWVVPVGNKQKLADAMIWCMLNPDKACEMAQRAQKAVFNKLDSKKLEQQWIDLLQKT